jgi:N-acetylmuramoyl-L-alanine amidase
MVALEDIASRFHLKLSYDPASFEVRLADPRSQREIKFYTYSTEVEGPRFAIRLSRHPEFAGARLSVPMDFGDRALRPLLTGLAPEPVPAPTLKDVDVVIDPGHGGNDYGASIEAGRFKVHEKNLTLRLALELAQILRDKGLSVSLTRTDDVYLTLPERTRYANEVGAKLFLSIHMNADPKGKSSGFETYVLSLKQSDVRGRTAVARENMIIPEDLSESYERALSELRAEATLEKSLEWAKTLSAPLSRSLKPVGRPIKMGPFYVLYGAEMPAILLELGFLTSANDREVMMSASSRQKLLKDLGESLAEHLKQGIKQP